MIIVRELTRESIVTTVVDLAEQGEVGVFMEECDEADSDE